jgi:hypothetical protein
MQRRTRNPPKHEMTWPNNNRSGQIKMGAMIQWRDLETFQGLLGRFTF